MLELEKLQKSYRKNEVLQDVSITVKEERVYALWVPMEPENRRF